MKNRFELNAPVNVEPRIAARQLYWQGWRITDIARTLGLKPPVVYSWKNRDNWDGGSPVLRIAMSAETRLHALINQPKKSDADYKEMKNLTALIQGYPRKGDWGDLTEKSSLHMEAAPWNDEPPSIDNPPCERRKEKRVRVSSNRKTEYNTFSESQIVDVQRIFYEQLFDYQRVWLSQQVRFRNLLKSRQIGATFFFAREALVDALVSGKNKVFLSASRAQAF